MAETSRRTFNQQMLGSLLTFSLLETLFMRDAFSDDVKPLTAEWLTRVNQLSQDLKGKELKQTEWQQQVEALFAKIDLPELLEFLDFEKLRKNTQYRERGERAMRPRFPRVEGLPTQLVFGHQIFALRKDRSVVPHGHNNMATSFLILNGEFHGRHYDRLNDEEKHMIIKPTIDRRFTPGEYSTVSDYKDNVHWFKATSETGFIFNMHVLNLMAIPDRGSGRVYIDPNGEKLANGQVRARKIKLKEALQRYG